MSSSPVASGSSASPVRELLGDRNYRDFWPRIAGVAAFVVGTFMVMMQPNLNAIVPELVPPERLMNAAALQNAGGQTANFSGLAFGGLIIGLLGNAAGFGLVAVVMAVSFALMWRVSIPFVESTSERGSIGREVMEGVRYGLGSEPRRSLHIATIILGSSFAAMQISMPRVVEEDFGRGSFAAGVLLGRIARCFNSTPSRR